MCDKRLCMLSVKKYQRITKELWLVNKGFMAEVWRKNTVYKKHGTLWYAQQTPNNHHTKNKAYFSAGYRIQTDWQLKIAPSKS